MVLTKCWLFTRKYEGTSLSLIFGFLRLENKEQTPALETVFKDLILNGSIGDLSILHGAVDTYIDNKAVCPSDALEFKVTDASTTLYWS